MHNEEINDMLNETGGHVPKLDMLNQEQALSVLAYHVTQCDKHADIVQSLPTIQIDLANEHLRCSVCGCFERFQVHAHHAVSLSEYLCRILRQGAKFDKLHFETCAALKGAQQ